MQTIEALQSERETIAKRIGFMSRCIPVGQLNVRAEDRPEWEAIHARQHAIACQIVELLRPEREAQAERELAANRARWAQEANAVSLLPVKQRRNGWDICADGCNYILRCPTTKTEIYKGKLSRCRQVADECKPD